MVTIIIAGGARWAVLGVVAALAYAFPPVTTIVNDIGSSVAHLAAFHQQQRADQADWLDDGQLNNGAGRWAAELSDGTIINCSPKVAAISIGNLPEDKWNEAHGACNAAYALDE